MFTETSLDYADIYKDFKDPDSLDELQIAHDRLLQRESELSDHLGWTVSNRHILEARLSQLTYLVSTLQLVRGDAKKLENTISFTHELANTVSSKVRQLDLAKSHVSEVQKCVGDLLDLEGCADGVTAALANEDFEKAAVYIQRFLSMDQSILRHSADSANKGQRVEMWFERMKNAEIELAEIIATNFHKAALDEDSASIERFFKLFPLLNKCDEGLKKFTDYLCTKISIECTKNINKAKLIEIKDKRSHIIWADTVTLLFEDIARTIEIHQPIIETYYGPGRLQDVVLLIQNVCDSLISEIIKLMWGQRNIERFTNLVQDSKKTTSLGKAHNIAASQTQLSTSKSSLLIDPRTLDTLLCELTLMNARAELYLRFIRRRINADLKSSINDIDLKQTKIDAFESKISQSQLVCDMAILIGSYTILEQYYLNESFKKAITLEAVEKQALMSSLLDDAFYIIKKGIRRSIASNSVDGVCAVINYSVELLERQLYPNIQNKLRKGFSEQGYLDLSQAYTALHSTIQSGKMSGKLSDADIPRKEFLTALNNAEACIHHIESLRNDLEQTIFVTMRDLSVTNRAKMNSCLADLISTSARFGSLTEFGLGQLQATAIKPKIKSWVDTFIEISHDITEEELSSFEANDPFSHDLMIHMDHLLGSFISLLTPENHKSFVEVLVKELATQMEKAVLKCSFNRFGGMQFDRDIRSISAYLSQVSEWGVREHLSRVQQIATLVNLEELNEISEYSNGSTWRLTPSDMKKILQLRVEFKNDEIQKLKL